MGVLTRHPSEPKRLRGATGGREVGQAAITHIRRFEGVGRNPTDVARD